MDAAVTDTDTWMPIAKAAARLGVHPRTLRRYIRDGRIPVYRLSSQVVLIRPEDLDIFTDANISVTTGTGTCYVPRPDAQRHPTRVRKLPTAAPPPKFTR